MIDRTRTQVDVNGPQNQDPASQVAFPTEPFPCPSCGQMLASTCRVCVACKQPIDPASIRMPREEVLQARARLGTSDRVRFPWGLFFGFMIVRLLVLASAARLLGVAKAELLVGSIEIVTSIWIFYDAPRRHIAKSLRWFLGSLFLWAVFFPWYLVRRRAPEMPCPLVETDANPVARTVLFILLVLILLGTILMTMQKLPK